MQYDNTFNDQTTTLDRLYYHSSIIRALGEEERNFDGLLTRTREILRDHEVNFAREQLNQSLKPLMDFEIISKKKDGRNMIYSLNDNSRAKEGISLIVAVEEGSSTIEKNHWLTQQYEQRVHQIQESHPENMGELLSEITSKLVEFSMFMFKLSIKLMYFQNQSMRLPFLVRELREQERKNREDYDNISMLMRRMGAPYYPRYLEKLDDITGKEIVKEYEKFVKDNQFLNPP